MKSNLQPSSLNKFAQFVSGYVSVFIIVCLTQLYPGYAQSQDDVRIKRFHLGVNGQILLLKNTGGVDEIESNFKTGAAVGVVQHMDLDARTQLRGGLGVMFGNSKDINDDGLHWPSEVMNGEYVPSKEGGAHLRSSFAFLTLPVNLRYAVGAVPKHFYIAGGLEGRLLAFEKKELMVFEPGSGPLIVNNDVFVLPRKLNLHGTFELGYEFPAGSSKWNVNAVVKRGLLTQYTGQGGVFRGFLDERMFEIGCGLGYIF